jgi:hypothetical protein
MSATDDKKLSDSDFDEQANLIVDLKAPCGCWRKVWYNDDPDFSGYDTDREECDEHCCERHQNERNRLKLIEKSLRERVTAAEQQLRAHETEVKISWQNRFQ